MKNKLFKPKWIEKEPPQGSFREVFKYGATDGFKHPSKRLVAELMKIFELDKDYFENFVSTGIGKVQQEVETKLDPKHVDFFVDLCGKNNVSVSTFDRLKYSTGKTVEEALILRKEELLPICDIVLHPLNKQIVKKIIDYCNENDIAVYVYGGGSSVNLGLMPVRGGVTLVMSTHMNKVLEINEKNQTAIIEAGIMGPELESQLNLAKELFGTKHNFTCGHFPQSFEFSSAGGWFVTLGSGQESSYYGDAADLVLAVEIVTPVGTIKTLEYPATATGPKILDLIKGSEGTLGVVVEMTWKLYRFEPQNRKRFAFIFKDWQSIVEAAKEISQGEFGMPAVMRISDEEETHFGLKLYGIDGTVFDKMMSARGYEPMKRCLFIGASVGEKNFAANVEKQIKKICKKFGAMYLTSFPVNSWEKGRYKDPYLREDLMDYGIIIDTLECTVKWDNLHKVHSLCRKFVKENAKSICMTHSSHFYKQGTNLYFIFLIKEQDKENYLNFQRGLIETIEKSGASLSHHHGVGKMIGYLMDRHLGEDQMKVLRAIKKHFDPKNIMNPGGQLGLDIINKKE